jgi:predicted ABC-type ATPase
MKPLLILLAGPNGAGKSTFHDLHLASHGIPFINADRIALETFGNQDPETSIPAARLAEAIREDMLAEGRSFIFETVLSEPQGAKIAFLAKARAAGYFVDAHFIGIASPALSQARVIHRVENGGHDVPDDKIAARYPRVMDNLRRLVPVASRLTIYDNSETTRPHRPVACFQDGTLVGLSAEIPAWLDFLDLPSLATLATKPLP